MPLCRSSQSVGGLVAQNVPEGRVRGVKLYQAFRPTKNLARRPQPLQVTRWHDSLLELPKFWQYAVSISTVRAAGVGDSGGCQA